MSHHNTKPKPRPRERTECGVALALLVRGLRAKKRMTQAELAAQTKVTAQAIKEIEWGWRKERLNSWLCRALEREGLPGSLVAYPTIPDVMRYLRQTPDSVPEAKIASWARDLEVVLAERSSATST